MKKICLNVGSFFLSLFLIPVAYGMDWKISSADIFEAFYVGFRECEKKGDKDEMRLLMMEAAHCVEDLDLDADLKLVANRLDHLSELYYKTILKQGQMLAPFMEDLHQYYTLGDKKYLDQFTKDYFQRRKAFKVDRKYKHARPTKEAVEKQQELVAQKNPHRAPRKSFQNPDPILKPEHQHQKKSDHNNNDNDCKQKQSSSSNIMSSMKAMGGLLMTAVVVGVAVICYRWYRSSVKNGKKSA